MNSIEKYKDKLIKAIEYHLPHTKIYLFGSQATGHATTSSDIDIALDNRAPLPFGLRTKILETIDNLNIPYNVDIVDFQRAPEDLKKSILTEKIIWKE